MNVKSTRVLCVAMMVLGSPVWLQAADRWADDVFSFDQPAGSSMIGGPPSAALGAPDGVFVSIDIPEELILAFTDNQVVNGPGFDLRIHGAGTTSSVDLFGCYADGPCTYLGPVFAEGRSIDIEEYGLDTLDFVRFVGLNDDGQFPGYDLDAVEALHCKPRDAACPIPAPGALLLVGLGTGLVGAMRRRVL